jgi:pectinesterase
MKEFVLKLKITAICLTVSQIIFAQQQVTTDSKEYLELAWKQVATKMPADWYGSDEAKRVAENVLLSQKEIGGWAKNKPYHHNFTGEEKNEFASSRSEVGATFDNGSTIMEMIFLSKVFNYSNDERYRTAFIKGLDYIFLSQYGNGGWPQFFPFRKGESVAYAAHITYNDNAMVNILKLLRDIVYDKEEFRSMKLDDVCKQKAADALNKGIGCIVKTQIVVDGTPTVWCAQHDAATLAPANARKFELASFSGTESAEIAEFLMTVKNPSKEVIYAVDCAVKWFDAHKIEGIKLVKEKASNGKKDLIVVADESAPVLWARFYDLETGKPFFCDRDGIKKSTIAEIGYERRNGYDWYSTTPSRLASKYKSWKEKLDSKK